MVQADLSKIQDRVKAREHQEDSNTIPSFQTLNTLYENIPMHRRFLREIDKLKTVSTINVKMQPKDEMKRINQNFDETTKRSLNVLSSPWWVRLYEGEHKPETRRAHSATIFAVDISSHENQITNSSDLSDESNSRYTLTLNRQLQTVNEYMIISGGFTDRDWKTFPVWAYNITSSIENDEGRWYDITPPGPSDDSICRNSNSNGVHNSNENLWSQALPCAPPSRVGHISVVRENYLYIFGGLMYDEVDGIFVMEKMPYMYRMLLSDHNFEGRDYENYEKNFKADGSSTAMRWERILPNVIQPPRGFIGDEEPSMYLFLQMVNRGEVRGGYWESEDKLVIYGGLHVREYETNFRRKQQADQALGDVWTYDFKTDTWEMLSPSWGIGNSPHPGARTSHGGVVVGDELLINGGLREEEMYVWNGETIWQQLEDVWVFNLKTRVWKERVMITPVGRSYQSTVGYETNDKVGSVLVMFGGFKSVMDPVDNQLVSYVYDDTLISYPPSEEWTQKSVWFAATFEGFETNMISTRLEHSAVLSKSGNMLVWGGRYRGTSEINGLWSLNIAGPESNVKFDIHIEEENVADIGYAYVVLITIMMTSMMITYMCGVIQRRMEAAGNSQDNANHDQTSGGSVFGRTGLSQGIIDTLPLKIYSEKDQLKVGSRSVSTEGLSENSSSSNDSDLFRNDCDDNCCPICLGEYSIGDELRRLPCDHEFHRECVDNWLSNHASCPACRHSLQDLVNLTTAAETVAAQIRAATARFMRGNSHENQSQIEMSTFPTRTDTQDHSSIRSVMSYQPNDLDRTTSNRDSAIGRLQRLMRLRRMNRSLNIPTSQLIISPSDSFDTTNGEIGYASSLELTEELDITRSASSADDGDLPLAGQSGRMMVNSRRQERRSRREGVLTRTRQQRRNRLPGSPLNAPLQMENSIV